MGGSLGQTLGFIGGAILGAVLAGPLGFAGAGIITAIMMGASIGSIAGGLIDPPRIGNQLAQHEIREVLYNTFAQDLPVPILYGKRRITGNIIFVGDTYGKVEDVGDQKVGQGKNEQEVDVFKVIYYADFIIGLGEGPFRKFEKTLQDEVDISRDEGELFTMRFGTTTEEIAEIVLNSPNPVLYPIGYSNTAQLIWSGKIGEINHIPSIEVECIGPWLKREVTGTPPAGMPTTIRGVMFDDLSDFVICQSTAQDQVISFKRDGTKRLTTTIPAPYTIERAFYLGRWDTLIVFTQVTNGLRWILTGQLGLDAASTSWRLVPMSSNAAQTAIKHAFVEDGTGHVYTFHITAGGVVMVKTSIHDFSQIETNIGLDVPNLLIRGTYYDKVEGHVYVLYSNDALLLKIKRYTLEYPLEVEDVTMGPEFEWINPIGIALTGELITIFDTGLDQPISQFAWGETKDRYKRGYKYTVASFTPDIIPDLEIWYAANLESTALPGQPIVNPGNDTLASKFTDQSGHGIDATQGNDNYKPKYYKNAPHALNSKAVWWFNGVDNFVRALHTTIDRQEFTLFVVHKPDTTADPTKTHPLFHSASGLNNDNNATYIAFGGPRSTQNGRIWQSQEEHFFDETDYACLNEWQISEVVGDDEGWMAYKNGGLEGQHDHENVGNIDVKIWIGTNHNLDVNYKGYVAEIIFYDRPLTDEERVKVEMYLRQKYAIAGYNPSNPAHLYFGLGDRITYANPVEFWFADQIQSMFVLDNAQTGYLLSWNHWNGDNWSYIRATSFKNVWFEEDGTVGGAMWAVHTHQRFGVGMGESFIGLYDLERVSGFCNRPVDMRYYTNDELVYAAAYQINYLLAANKRFSEIVREFLTCFNGFLFYSAGIIKVKVDRDNGVVEFEDDLDTILEGTFEFWEIAREDRWNKVRVEVTDERNDYKPVPVTATAEWERDIFGETRITTIVAEGCTRPRQGVLLAVNSLLGQTMRRFACKYRVGPQGLRREVGDVGLVTHPHPGWNKKKFMIVAISETEDDELDLTLMEHVPNIHTVSNYPLQQPQLSLDLAPGAEGSFDDVKQATRVKIIEDKLEGRAFLLASKPTKSGPWKFLRWYAKWINTNNPGAQFYPGQIPFNTTQHTAFFITAAFTASALLKTDLGGLATDLTIELEGVTADPPETNFDIIIYNPAISTAAFAGQYERCQGALYNESNKKITLDTGGRGYSTPIFTHSNVSIPILACYTRHGATSSALPVVWFWLNSTVNPVASPLVANDDEWYIAFNPAVFGIGPNSVYIVTTGGAFTGLQQQLFGSQSGMLLEYEVYYSSGEGLWTELRGLTDETLGFKQSGRISWDLPIVNPPWVTTSRWRESTSPTGTSDYFKTYVTPGPGGGTPQIVTPARYYLKFVRKKLLGNIKSGSLSIGFSSTQPVGKRQPVIYFLKHNAIPFYDTVPSEQGYMLEFKVQPIGHHGQTIDVEQLTPYPKTFQNLAGEGG